jgi:hypothetical protein
MPLIVEGARSGNSARRGLYRTSDPIRGLLIKVTLEEGRLRVDAEVDSLNRSVKVGVGDQVREIRSGESYTFGL